MRGSNLKKRRIELGLTLEEVGNIVGVGKSTVRKWETGSIENMKRDKIALLAKALQTTPLFIMGVEETETSNIVEFNDFEIKLIEKYRELDEKGKHTVNTVLNMEYNRLRKSHLEVVAAHTDDYSEDQIKLMKQDLEEL
ncbi:helix-turn-helix domain-containing protein [Paenibacillus sp. FSL P4-0081]|uniref:helix-turn-helix domain-containing protein n=1 Tax=Paenibacillus sp. FSL P4-0081 TaxID=1536769 RepID=UPI0007C7A800|nr:helix-turn-helix transcriptional regulator [Paenibacillus sp. FSL P4-0081]